MLDQLEKEIQKLELLGSLYARLNKCPKCELKDSVKQALDEALNVKMGEQPLKLAKRNPFASETPPPSLVKEKRGVLD